jgi:hypothetical protein
VTSDETTIKYAVAAVNEALKKMIDLELIDSTAVKECCTLVLEFFDGNREKTALWFIADNPYLGTSPIHAILSGKEHKLLSFIKNAKETGGW